MTNDHNHDPLQPHAHEPNPEPPSPDPAFTLIEPSGNEHNVAVSDLKRLRPIAVPNCYIVSTGHGTSGPFTFTGARLLDVVRHYVKGPWAQVEVLSADGFGNRVFREELVNPDPDGPIVLAFTIDGREMTREQGLVRLIVPSERDDALRQVKWVGEIRVRR
ncbi:MAG TPA: molybdopterin-dependent oxidoreductase [Candidatus Sulfomarinibacteraceae bacterium]|nr:molybdopterin-dependent oxidoreductase [Candidatus Sulfomarinibacteraceae bacterium]